MASNSTIDPDRIINAIACPIESTSPLNPAETPVEAHDEISTSLSPVYRNPLRFQILAPIPDPALVRAVSTWLSHRDLTLSDLVTGAAFGPILNVKEPPEGIRARYFLFSQALQQTDAPSDNVPSLRDIRLHRNWPQLLCSLAHIAQAKDAQRWQQCLQEAGANHPHRWRDVMSNEAWDGDSTVRHIARLMPSHTTIAIAGSQGSGKSATLNTLLSRNALPPSHAFLYEPPEYMVPEEERDVVDIRRHLIYLSWPDFPVEHHMPNSSVKIDVAHVKVDGTVLSFLELPEMGDAFDHYYKDAETSYLQHGTFAEVLKDLQGKQAHIVLLVERLDEFDEVRFRAVARRVRHLFGTEIFHRLIVILTHGRSHPPEDLNYQLWKFDQIRKTREHLQKVWKKCPQVPVIIFENSESCPVENGRRTLCDGTEFVHEFLNRLEKIVGKEAELFELVPVPPRRSWETAALTLAVSLLLWRMR